MDQQAYREMAVLQNHHWWFVARRNIFEKIITNLKLPVGAQILEIGCGPGGNLRMLQKHGHLTAVELDQFARQFAQNNIPDIDILEGMLPDQLPFKNMGFDLICLFDVLEHIQEDVQSLQSLVKFLNPNGKVLITVPAYKLMTGPHDIMNHHKRRYTKNELLQKARSAGFCICYASYFNTLLFPLAASIRLFEKIFLSSSRGMGSPSLAVNWMLEKIFTMESKILPKLSFPYGLSVIAVLEKE